jgi:hypothetical protein
MNNYQNAKEKARHKAIEWQVDFPNNNHSWGELAEWAAYFKRLGKRYGLMREFGENGIC